MKVSELITRLQNRNPDDVIAYAIWDDEDVRVANASLAEDEENLTEDEDISQEECDEVLRRAEYYHDCEQGITWDTIKYHIEEVKENRSK